MNKNTPIKNEKSTQNGNINISSNGELIKLETETDITERKKQKYTFEKDDKFGRKCFAVQLNSMILDSDIFKENESFSIAIDASWGMGKTQFINMWINMLDTDELGLQCRPIYYNAWKHDDYDDALLPLVCNVCEEFIENNRKDQHILDVTKRVLKFGFSTLVRIGCAAIPGLGQMENIGKELSEIISDKQACDFYNNFAQKENAKNEFRNAIKELVGNQEKLIIFIDELDRCRPTFAIETLEVIKHFFNIDNVVFIFALDIIQLSKSIETIYGQGMDACGYLTRFFDIQVNLPVPSVKQYFDSIPKLVSLRSEIILNFMNCLAIEFHISAREINMFSKAWIYYIRSRHSCDNWEQGFCFFVLLLILKYKRKEQFQDIVTGKKPSVEDSNIINDNIRDYYHIASTFASYSMKTLNDFRKNGSRFTNLVGTDKELGQKLATHLVGDSNLKDGTGNVLGRLLHESIELIYPKQLIDS